MSYTLLLENLLKEAANRDTHGLALEIIEARSGIIFILYSADKVIRGMKEIAAKDRLSAITNSIDATITLLPNKPGEFGNGQCLNSMEVVQSRAVAGYGPFVYELAMSHIHPRPITCDRFSVSSSAAKVWKVFQTRKDVDIVDAELGRFDDKNNPKTKTKVDDCEIQKKFGFDRETYTPSTNIFNNAIRYSGQKSAVSELVAAHKEVVRKIHEYDDSLDEMDIKRFLSRASSEFFMS